MILRRRHEAEWQKKVNPRLLELQAAKEILAEIFQLGLGILRT